MKRASPAVRSQHFFRPPAFFGYMFDRDGKKTAAAYPGRARRSEIARGCGGKASSGAAGKDSKSVQKRPGLPRCGAACPKNTRPKKTSTLTAALPVTWTSLSCRNGPLGSFLIVLNQAIRVPCFGRGSGDASSPLSRVRCPSPQPSPHCRGERGNNPDDPTPRATDDVTPHPGLCQGRGRSLKRIAQRSASGWTGAARGGRR